MTPSGFRPFTSVFLILVFGSFPFFSFSFGPNNVYDTKIRYMA